MTGASFEGEVQDENYTSFIFHFVGNWRVLSI